MSTPAEPQERICFEEFELNLRTRELQKDGNRSDLQEQPFQVLTMLLEHAGDLVTREDLIKRLWPSDTFVDFERSLNKAVKRLREALHDSAEEPRFIETLPRRGYRFIGRVTPTFSPTPEPPEKEVAREIVTVPRRRWLRGRVAVLSGLALLLAASAFVFWITRRGGRVSGGAPIRSLAVLPLENLSGDASQDYFADGMTDELITDLGEIAALRVISRTTAMQYKGAHKSLPQIARELKVDAVVEGTVVRSGDRVRITAQLIEAPADKQLWARSYEGDVRDVLGLQNQVASGITEQIRIKLTPQEQTRLAGARQVNPQAYEAFLKGDYFWHQITPKAEQKALQYFRQAVESDANFARAHVGMARTYSILGNIMVIPPGEAYPASDAAVAKALEIEPGLGEAYAQRAFNLLIYHWDFPGAEREFRHAIELDPGASNPREGYAAYLVAMGRFDEGLEEIRRARDLDPLSLLVNTDYCVDLYRARRFDEALAQCRATLEIDPEYRFALRVTAELYERKGAYPEAHELYRKAWGCEGACIAMIDEISKAPGAAGGFDAWMKTKKDLTSHAWFLAFAYASLGRNDQAFAWLEKAYVQRSDMSEMINLGVDPAFDSLHSDQRFAAFLRRVGLPPQADVIAYRRANP